MTDDRTLLKRARANDPAALGGLYDRYAPKMYAYFYRRVGDAALAEDLTSELFLRFVKAIRNGTEWQHPFVGWLYRVAHNLVVDYYRDRTTFSSVQLSARAAANDDDDGNPVMVAEKTLMAEKLFQAVRQLTLGQQEVLVLRFGEGLTAREVGEILGKTTGAVEALQRRGLAGLRRILARGEES